MMVDPGRKSASHWQYGPSVLIRTLIRYSTLDSGPKPQGFYHNHNSEPESFGIIHVLLPFPYPIHQEGQGRMFLYRQPEF